MVVLSCNTLLLDSYVGASGRNQTVVGITQLASIYEQSMSIFSLCNCI